MYALRIGGTNEFVSRIDPLDGTCIPPGSISSVKGWTNPRILKFDSREDAEVASEEVLQIEGCSCSIEVL